MTEFKDTALVQLLKDSFSYAISKIIPGVAGLFSVILFFRWVGPDAYGQYSILFSFINILAAFSFGWLNQSILRYSSTFSEKNEIIYPIGIGLLFGLIFIFFTLFILRWVQFPASFSFWAGLGLAFSIGIFNVVKAWFQSNEEPTNVILLTGLQSVLMIVCTKGMITYMGPTAKSILVGVTLGYLLPSLPTLKKFNFVDYRNKNGKVITRQFFNFGAPLSIWLCLSLLLNFLDRYFIEYFYGQTLMGSYAGFSEFILRIFSILIFPITMAIHPKVMNVWNHGKNIKKSMAQLRQGIGLQLTVFMAFLIGVVLFKASMFSQIQQWVPGIDNAMKDLLIPLVIGGFLWQFALIMHKPLEIKEKTTTMVAFMGIAVMINLVGNYFFLPKYGIIVTAYTMIVSASTYIIACTMVGRSLTIQPNSV